MQHRHPRLVGPGLVAFALLLGAAACGDDDDTAAPPSTTSTSTTLPTMPTDFDWWHPNQEVPLGGGWVLRECAGNDPTLCFEHPDGRSGIVELFRFQAPPDRNLNAHAARFVDDFLADRRAGCGKEYRVEAEPIEPLELPGRPGPALRVLRWRARRHPTPSAPSSGQGSAATCW